MGHTIPDHFKKLVLHAYDDTKSAIKYSLHPSSETVLNYK